VNHQIENWGWHCAYIDMSELKATDESAWYRALAQRISDQLTPGHVPVFNGPNDLKTYFVHVLSKSQPVCPVVLLLDEIGNAQKLASCEQLFLTLRSMYRQPADYPILKNFTLVLAGTVDPDSLVRDTSNSPFNYGERVPLHDFTEVETRQLTNRLKDIYSEVNESVHTRIYDWTSGQPYLTQKVCAILERWHNDDKLYHLEPSDIDHAVQKYFLDPDPLKPDSNISHILDGLKDERLKQMVQAITRGQTIRDREAIDLYLLGVIKKVRGRITIRNRIYASILTSLLEDQMSPTFNNAHALLIGVGNYEHPRFADLPATMRDAQAMATLLTEADRCGYPSDNVKIITGEQATAINIRAALQAIGQSTTPQSTVFVYFSGHGGRAFDNGAWRTYLCPREADPDNLANTAIPGEEFSTLLSAVPASKMLVMLDACHAGTSAELKAADGTTTWKAGLLDTYYEALSQGSGRVVIASSKPEQYSYVRKQGDLSLFTWHLREALSGQAAIRGDGLIHVLDVFHYVNESVTADEPNQVPILKVKDLDLNFPIALDRGGKAAGPATVGTPAPIADIREQIVRSPIAGAKALSGYLATRSEWAAKRNEVDLKRADLERVQHDLDLFGPNRDDEAAKNRVVYFLLRTCLSIEQGEV
jgi:hypothetical protein